MVDQKLIKFTRLWGSVANYWPKQPLMAWKA